MTCLGAIPSRGLRAGLPWFRASVLSLGVLSAALGCGPTPEEQAAPVTPAPPSLAPNAQPQILASLREDLARERHPSDGGGQAWLETNDPVTAGDIGRWVVVFETGPAGIDVGGWVLFQVSPFWGWSTPQVNEPEALGYTEVTTEAVGVELHAHTLDQQLLGVEIGGRALAPGEQVRIDFGAGAAGARADRWADRRSRFWIGVDGDGDGVRRLLVDSPAAVIEPGSARRLHLTLPSTAAVGDTVPLTVAALDAQANGPVPFVGTVGLRASGSGLDLPATLELRPEDGGTRRLEVAVASEGAWTVVATTEEGLGGESNPLFVSPGAARILWGDLHGHSGLSDGTGTPDDYFRYARDVAALDVVALTDHDHWGLRPLALAPDLWDEIVQATAAYHEPGRFVTILGYEWTSWIHGHRHVLYFADQGEIFSSVDPAYESPEQLWAALEGRSALTFAHHSAGGPVATNWSIPPDPVLEPVTEVVSVHGVSEAPDTPGTIYSAVPGNFVRDVLDRGYRLGFVGSGDSHDGHPGLAAENASTGGLAAILAPDLTREAVLEALRARRVYATSGPRIVLQTALDGHRMGASVPPGSAGDLSILVVGTGPIAAIDVVHSGELVRYEGASRAEVHLTHELGPTRAGEYVYVRILQEDGGLAWSSPFFISEGEGP